MKSDVENVSSAGSNVLIVSVYTQGPPINPE